MTEQIMVIAADTASLYLIRRFAEESGLEVVHEMGVGVRLAIIDADSESSIGRLQADIAEKHVPVCVCSWQEAHNLPTSEITIDCYLQKPFLFSDFRAALEASGIMPHAF